MALYSARRDRTRLESAAVHNLPVLIVGESGTGKTHLAREIHTLAKRHTLDASASAFVSLNLATVPDGAMAEALLVGHYRGAFTDAHSDRLGVLQLADGGTLFLDELHRAPAAVQARLLKLIERDPFVGSGSGGYPAYPLGAYSALPARRGEPVGDDEVREKLRRFEKSGVRCWLVAATTSRDQQRVEREILERLGGVTVHIPPLRDRFRDDEAGVRALIDRQLSNWRDFRVRGALERLNCDAGPKQAEAEQRLGIPQKYTVNEAGFSWLRGRPWPGNVRELLMLLGRAILVTRGGVRRDGEESGELGEGDLRSAAEYGLDVPLDASGGDDRRAEGLLTVTVERIGAWFEVPASAKGEGGRKGPSLKDRVLGEFAERILAYTRWKGAPTNAQLSELWGSDKTRVAEAIGEALPTQSLRDEWKWYMERRRPGPRRRSGP